ncbi:sigma-54 dependent transcriptional regulator [Gilvimarinus sp. SDUM040013]|uniref:Sigma-54 dependent transcriptional regulator n=1 Tax=Gilvimarinus gilvus TaxID=3058038 RepID=A0ABU4RZL8_9GAMM|nr:sigma-54 dependent transcriptional regulator [Gilvimarinus sp. SDUM040013]MDO3385064.1 sigma-54 dependent transcriptional regulator [Gilvimarinus sp. SDUM040013]MDX6848439.1 sigma-54 dependent transcriptional regulator [Gilvimarinus sp. SDUM040013]
MNDTAVAPCIEAAGTKILVTEDDPNLREALVDTLELSGYEVLEADCAEQAFIRLKNDGDIRLVISDVNMGKLSGYDLLRQVKNDYPHIPLVLITAYASIADSVMAIKEGAVDYLVKPFEPEALTNIVAKHVGQGGGACDDEPVANSESSKQLLQLAERVAQSESTVLIIGESGTGKEVLARYIHNRSPRADKPFVAINCAAIPENMLEATLFGHEKGAYTGAHSSAPGKFEQANGGTLLLDEISEMDIGLQAKLLRVLQEREVERLGGRKTIRLNVRVIATSNRDMREAVVAGNFREDLYYRLSILPLQWAPLRDRPEDIVPLAEKLLQKHAQKQNRRGASLDKFAKSALLDYRWPGNVRELDNIMQRALILQPGSVITNTDLGLVETTNFSDKPSVLEGHLAAAPHGQAQMQPLQDSLLNDSTAACAELGSDLKQREFEIIRQTLVSERGSRKNTAETLGISPRTLRYKIARLKDEGFVLDV